PQRDGCGLRQSEAAGAVRVYKDFHFDAAHHLPTVFPPGHPNHRLHGHSYRVRVTLEGEPCPRTGMVEDLGAVHGALQDIKAALDHHYLNEDVPGLGVPTLENLTLWIWAQLAERFSGLAVVGVFRDSSGEGCEYQGPQDHHGS
ncbi:MAG: 6-carboxytetrahydropterin synthase, partial [Pseudomonadota bacterium]